MLRISIDGQNSTAILKVEGKLVGPWASELGDTWKDLYAPVGQKPLEIDLRGLTFVDRRGTQILREIVNATGASIFADSPLTAYFASQILRDPSQEERE